MEQIILSHEYPMVQAPITAVPSCSRERTGPQDLSRQMEMQIFPPTRLGACNARRRAVTAEESGTKPQMNTDKHRCGYNNSIYIFQSEHSTINLQCHHPAVPA